MHAWLNQSILYAVEGMHVQSGQPAPEEEGGVDWAAIDGGVSAAVVFLVIVVVLVIKRDAEAVVAVLQQLTSLLEAATALLARIRRRRRPSGTPAPSAPPAPNGNNFTDSFLLQWRGVMQERAQEARSAYV